MCGIAGIIADTEPAVRAALGPMGLAQKCRGPDDDGQYYGPFGSRFLGLDHRRLSILDLSPAGHEPMVHPVTGDVLIFNGEIYNFVDLRQELEAAGETFRGHCDAEVLLHGLTRWGPDCIGRLHGMFAFAFFDIRGRRLLLARDSIGIKPLYVAAVPGALLFASQVGALLASGLVPSRLDPRGLAGYLAYGAVQHPATMIQNVRSFPPGHYQTFGADAPPSEPRAFWTFPAIDASVTETQAVSTLQTTLDESVRRHLVSDVPVGVFLSSGLDSTILAGLAARHAPRLCSFTVAFADQPDMSEHVLAAETARLFGLDHSDIQITGRDAEAAAVAWLQSVDQPSIDGLNVYVISKAVRARGITVALSGQGGDELFGGYPSFAELPSLVRLFRRLRFLPPPLRAALARAAACCRSQAVREKLADMARGDGGIESLYFHRRRAMSDAQLASLGIAPEASSLSSDLILPADLFATISRFESIFYQGNTLLRVGDSNSMAHSLEVRVPMLDQRMLDYAYALPGRIRAPAGAAPKHLLRVAFPQFLRPELLTQSKRGFTLPLGRWMLGPLREICENGLSALKTLGVLRADAIDGIWNSYLAEPESPMWSRALALCAAGNYIQRTGLTA